jgi:hypothetical protein
MKSDRWEFDGNSYLIWPPNTEISRSVSYSADSAYQLKREFLFSDDTIMFGFGENGLPLSWLNQEAWTFLGITPEDEREFIERFASAAQGVIARLSGQAQYQWMIDDLREFFKLDTNA